jgi:hypothetical protein
MITNQILKTLLENASISENDGLTFKEIQQCLPEPITVKMLQSLRDDGLIKNSMKRNLNTWWLTAKGAEMVLGAVENDCLAFEQEQPSSASDCVNIDLDTDMASFKTTDCKTEQLAAALRECNEAITKLAAENIKLRDKLNNEEFDSNQHTDAFINAMNESRTPIEFIEFIILDENERVVETGLDTISDAIHKAYDLAASGGEYHVDCIARGRIWSAKQITVTQ